MAARSRASKAERREPFVLGDEVVRAGTSRELELRVARLPPGMWTAMPLVVVHGKRPGPMVWLSGAIHGDELGGVPIVRDLVGKLKPTKLAGTVIAVPIVNVFGVTIGSRYLPDRRDLNRSFPGSARGSLASRLARLFWDAVASRCSVGIDFHTGSGGRANLPQIRCDVDDEIARAHAEAFAAPLLLHASMRDGSLRAAARERGIRVLVYEAGEAFRFDREAIDLGVAGTLRVFQRLGMIDDAPPVIAGHPTISRKSSWTRAGRSGFCVLDVELGDRVVAGQRIATITDSIGKKQMSVRARSAGVVIGAQRHAMVHQGDAIVHIAAVEEP